MEQKREAWSIWCTKPYKPVDGPYYSLEAACDRALELYRQTGKPHEAARHGSELERQLKNKGGYTLVGYYKLGETAGKAWRLGHMDASEEESNDAAIDFCTREIKPEDRGPFYVGWDEGVAAVDADAAQVKQPEPVYIRDYTADGDTIVLNSDPESDPQHIVRLGRHGLSVRFSLPSLEQARQLVNALKQARVEDVGD